MVGDRQRDEIQRGGRELADVYTNSLSLRRVWVDV